MGSAERRWLADGRLGRGLAALGAALVSWSCRGDPPAPVKAEPATTASTPSAPARPRPGAPAAGPAASGSVGDAARGERPIYPWLEELQKSGPKLHDDLRRRFPVPSGFARVPVGAGTFGAWLRELPLAAPGTPVRAYDGRVLHEATDPRIAAVVALDVSPADLQQCADTVIRLHAEWLWSRGRRDMSYRAASGLALPWSRWARGERLVPSGANISWVAGGGAANTDHAAFRKYLDAVFAWGNTVSLEKQSKPVTEQDLAAGDFFILPGNPGHAVIVLDVATRGSERAALLGQSYMPAQNAQVLRSASGSAWFVLDPSQKVDTPFWKPFPWSSLRRLDG